MRAPCPLQLTEIPARLIDQDAIRPNTGRLFACINRTGQGEDAAAHGVPPGRTRDNGPRHQRLHAFHEHAHATELVVSDT